MRWGVRRYQNADGSYTEAGKRRYNYGSVTVQRKVDQDNIRTVAISNKQKTVELSEKSFNSIENDAERDIVNAIWQSNKNMPISKLKKSISEDPDTARQVNKLIDQYMDQKLTTILETYGSDKKSTSYNSEKPRVKAERKPRYTQEAAINKAYSDLEKKYPNFNKFSQDRQDELFFDYLNESGLYKYM